jgi:hypothetical protein
MLNWLMQAIEKSPQSECEMAQIPENRARNRFGNIFPCKHSELHVGAHIEMFCWEGVSIAAVVLNKQLVDAG